MLWISHFADTFEGALPATRSEFLLAQPPKSCGALSLSTVPRSGGSLKIQKCPPSGTALMLGDAAARGRGVQLRAVEERARDGAAGPRGPGAIGFASLRGGGIVGEHSVMFASEDEIITLSHSARDRGLFARGALAAAIWVADKPAGLYDMMDVLGFKTNG